jgi:pimeloyl-ACP methyl ester carboxylesterase
VQAKTLLKLAVLFGLIVIVVPMVVGGWLMWRRPFTVDAWVSRLALGRQGLEASELATPSGTMTVWEGGSGPTMVLLHGAGDQAGAWARVMGPLVERYRVVVPDLPGHWKSEPRTGPISVEQLLDGVSAVMDARSADEPAILVGNSMGAWIAFLYAVDHPDRVARLVAVNGGPIREEHPAVNLFPQNREQARETMKGLLGPNTVLPPDFVLDDMVRWANEGPAARLASRLARPDEDLDRYLLDGRLDEVAVPVDLLWGDADELFTMDYARRLLDGLPAARLHAIKDCGHVPHRECPDRMLAALTEALGAPPPEPVSGSDPEADVVAAP